MKVLIDADGCPVTSLTTEICARHSIPCFILCDTAHEIQSETAKTLVFDKGSDSVDYAIAARVSPGDIVVTQDYGLASICLARRARVLHQNGWEYTQWNIDALLFERHTARRLRASGARLKGSSRRTAQQNQEFCTALESLLNSVQG